MLDIDMEFKRGVLIVRLKGILNGDTSIILDDNLSSLVKDNGIKYLLINLDDLKFIDKYGIDILIKNYLLIKNIGGKFIICGLKKMFTNVNLLDNFYQVNEENKVFSLVKL